MQGTSFRLTLNAPAVNSGLMLPLKARRFLFGHVENERRVHARGEAVHRLHAPDHGTSTASQLELNRKAPCVESTSRQKARQFSTL